MILRLMTYAIVVGAAFAAAGAMFERVLALGRRPRRGAWMLALGATVLFIIAAPWRTPTAADGVATSATLVRPAGSVRSLATASFESAPWLDRVQRQIERLDLARLDPILMDVWMLIGLGAAGVYAGALWTLSRRRRAWRRARVGDLPLLVSDDDGPSVVGVWTPRIVVPEWALALDPAALDLMLAHEREHQRARDPLMVHAALLAAIAMPWNPAVWWMLGRLKLAVEMDCDARVLARSQGRDETIAYGELLLTLAARRSPRRPVIAPAMLDHPSSLRRRIAAMFPAHRRFAGVRLAGAAGASLGLLSLALLIPAPRLTAQAVSNAKTPSTQRSAAVDRAVRTVAPVQTQATSGQKAAPQKAGAGDVYEIGDGVSSPVPIRSQDPAYTQAAMAAKIQGDVHLEGVVEPSGILDKIRVSKSLDTVNGLDQAAIDAAKKWLFKPGMKDGKAVPVHVQMILEFKLRANPPSTKADDADFAAGAYQMFDAGIIAPRLIHREDAKYSSEAMRARVEGMVTVEVVISAQGTVDRARVVESLDKTYGLDDAALEAAKHFTFEPATLNGTPVPVVATLKMEFRLH